MSRTALSRTAWNLLTTGSPAADLLSVERAVSSRTHELYRRADLRRPQYTRLMRTASAALDHLVLATPDVDETAAWISERTGVRPSAGGQHRGMGTRNMLCSLNESSYLEIIGPDPGQPDPDVARPFGLDHLTEPTVAGWAIAVADIDSAIISARAAGFDPGDASSMERTRPDGVHLEWRLTTPTAPTVPFLIDWLGSDHPAHSAAPGLELVDLQASHPEPGPLAQKLGALGVMMGILPGDEALLVEVRGPLGSVQLPR
jgi:hypothetical protein